MNRGLGNKQLCMGRITLAGLGMYSSGLGLGYGSGFGIRARAWEVKIRLIWAWLGIFSVLGLRR